MDRLQAALDARIQRYIATGDSSAVLDPAALDEVAQLWEATHSPGGVAPTVPLDVLTVLAYFHWSRYEALPEGQGGEDLEPACALFELLLERSPERVPDEILRLSGTTSPPKRTDEPGWLIVEGACAFNIYQRTGRSGVLDVAVEAFQTALAAITRAAITRGDRDLPMCLTNLGNALTARFEQNHEMGDLDAAINAAQQAVATTPSDDPARATYLSNLSNALCIRAKWLRSSVDLDAAIDIGQKAVAAAPQGYSKIPSYLTNLANAFSARFEQMGDSADLDVAIDCRQQAVAAGSHGRQDHSRL